MVTSIFCASKVSLLRRWYTSLKSFNTYIAKNKNELLEFLDTYNTPIVLIIESHLFEKDHGAFLEKLRDEFSFVKVCVLSNKPNIKEAQICIKLGVKGYGNSYMYKTHFQDMVNVVWDNKLWFYPDFITTFFPKNTKNHFQNPQATIKNISHLAIIRDEHEERIAEIGDTLKQDETIIAPYKDSHISLDIGDENNIEIEGTDSLYLDESVFVQDSFQEKAIIDKKMANKILDMLGVKPLKSTKNKSIKKDTSTAQYQGYFKEYTISSSKNFKGYFIIKDTITSRDGSDLIDENIQLLVFKDCTKTFQNISSEKTK